MLQRFGRHATFHLMEEAEVIFYFDYVDPASYVLERALRALAPARVKLAYRPFELRPPPLAPIEPESGAWRARCDGAARGAEDYGIEISSPRWMPWSRKAHELALHARAQGCCDAVHEALFRSFFEKKADIGRIDVLIALATQAGLDASETQAVLDVDRYAGEVEDMRDAALRAGLRGPPVLEADGRRLEGLPDREGLVGFLDAAQSDKKIEGASRGAPEPEPTR